MNLPQKPKAAFSLIELLVVVAIVITLMAIGVTALTGVGRSYRLTQAGQEIRDLLSGARMTAIARNRLIEVRFVQPQGEPLPTHIAVLERSGDNQLSLAGRVVPLPQNIRFSSSSGAASLLEGDATPGDFALPGLGTSYSFYALRFRPDGSTDLPWTPATRPRYFFTLQIDTDRKEPPSNFFTVEIDPLNGTLTTFRP